MPDLNELIKQHLGVDGQERVDKYLHIVERGIASDYEREIQAAATAGAISFKYGDAQGWWGAALTIFAIGYTAGSSQPDLGIFQEAVNEL